MGLTIFDIDDTLFHTTAQIKVMKDGKVVRSLTNQEFNNYQLQPDEEFDFGEFRSAEKFAQESEPIKPMINTLKRILDRATNTKVIMLTARADFDDKDKFLGTFEKYGIDMSRIHVHRAGNLPGDDPPAYKKAIWVRKYLNTGKYNRVNLIDDSMTNLKVFKSLEKEYPQVDFDAYFVKPTGSVAVVSESRRRKKMRQRKQNSLFSRNTGGVYGAWGPGPYGGYGYDAGYSGDGGGESIQEKIGDVSQFAEPGDTVYSIARQNNIDPAELIKFNNFNKDTKLKLGQEVKIPQKDKTDNIDTPTSLKSKPIQGQGAQPTSITGNPLETTLREFAIKAGIKGKELAQFLAQCAHETMNYASLVEFGNSQDFLKKYDPEFNPEKAKILGNTNPGDGEKFKGRGFIQLTGRWNYTQAGQALGLPLDQKPELLEKPDVAAKASVWFWKNRVQPNVKNFTDTRTVTSYINPGLHGLQRRDGIFQNYLKTMTSTKEDYHPNDQPKGMKRQKTDPTYNVGENMDHTKDDQAVPQLKAALLARKEKLQSATDDQVYDIIDKIMTRIAKTHDISGKKLHDMWVDKYNQVPDTWIMKENFADGRNPQDKGDSARHGIPKKASLSTLKSIRSSDTASPRKKQLAHWQINMRQGKKRSKE